MFIAVFGKCIVDVVKYTDQFYYSRSLNVFSLHIKVCICWSEKITDFYIKLCIIFILTSHYHQCAIFLSLYCVLFTFLILTGNCLLNVSIHASVFVCIYIHMALCKNQTHCINSCINSSTIATALFFVYCGFQISHEVSKSETSLLA